MKKPLIASCLAVALIAVPAATPAAAESTLDRLRDEGEIRLGYRVDAPPFSYRNRVGETTGYTIRVCRAVAEHLVDEVLHESLSLEFVEVTASNRFDMVANGEIDLLCGATTATLSRREIVDFSISTFVDGAGVLLRHNGPHTLKELDGQKIGVRKGTTTEAALRETAATYGITFETIAVPDHREGIARLRLGDIAGYFGDRSILQHFMLRMPDAHAEKVFLSAQQFTYEPYALAMQRGDNEFRLAVDRAISHIIRSGEIEEIFAGSFGTGVKPSPDVRALYNISPLPD